MGKKLRVLRGLFALGLLGALLGFVDWGRFAEVFVQLSPLTVLGMLLCGTGARLLGVLRWRVLCGGLLEHPPTVLRLFRLGLLAEFVNLALPSSLGGEVVRIWGVREHGSTAEATWSVVIDRSLGLVGLLLALVPVAVLVELPVPAWGVGMGLGAVGLGVVVGGWARPRLLRMGGWAAALARLDPLRVMGALLLSSASPWCLVGGYWLFFSVLHPISVPRVAVFVLFSRFGRGVPLQLFGLTSVEGLMWMLGRFLDIPAGAVGLSMGTNYFDKLVHSAVGGAIELLSNGTDLLRRLRRPE